MTNTAIILCGGKATRLGELAKDKPKALMELREDGYTILDAQLDLLQHNGITNIILATGHLSSEIREHMEYLTEYTRHAAELTWQISKENEPLGTGGAFRNAWKECCSPNTSFVGLNGDVYCPEVDIKSMIRLADKEQHHVACLAMKKHEIPFGTLDVWPAPKSGEVVTINDFKEKQVVLINAGVYYIKPAMMQYDMKRCSIAKDVFPGWSGHLLGYEYEGPWFDVGTPETLEAAREFVSTD